MPRMSTPVENISLAHEGKPTETVQDRAQKKTNFTFCFRSHCKRTMRMLAVFRLLTTAFLLLYYLLVHITEQHEIFLRLREEIVKYTITSLKDKRSYGFFSFIVGMVYSILNILITTLLWAGSFGEKKKCLPIYAFAEVLFTFCWAIPFFMTSGTSDNETIARVIVFVVYLALLILVIIKVLSPYYIYLGIIDKEKREREFERLHKLILSERICGQSDLPTLEIV